MEDNPTAAPQGTEAIQQSNIVAQSQTQEPVSSPEINAEQVAKFLGTDAETFGKFQKFVEANGKFDTAFSKMKTSISDPNYGRQAQTPETNPTSQEQQFKAEMPAQPVYKAPEGSITAQEFLAQQYFQGLSKDPKYEAISAGIASGEYLKEMSAFGIQPLNQDGSINDQKVRMYLDLKAQTVPAKQTGTEPNMSNAPTVEYVQIAGDKITSMNDALAILNQDIQLAKIGQHHPRIAEAEAFIKNKGQTPVDNAGK